jgi:hypothetical protein
LRVSLTLDAFKQCFASQLSFVPYLRKPPSSNETFTFSNSFRVLLRSFPSETSMNSDKILSTINSIKKFLFRVDRKSFPFPREPSEFMEFYLRLTHQPQRITSGNLNRLA